jgi:hypothetical protein
MLAERDTMLSHKSQIVSRAASSRVTGYMLTRYRMHCDKIVPRKLRNYNFVTPSEITPFSLTSAYMQREVCFGT